MEVLWVLTICMSSFVPGCGSIHEKAYETEKQCYKALDEIYKRQDKNNFDFITCSPRRYDDEIQPSR